MKLIQKVNLKSFLKKYLVFLIPILILVVGTTLGLIFILSSNKTSSQGESYDKFLLEIYDQINEYYWEKTSEEQIANLYKLATEKITNKPQELKIIPSQNPEPTQNLNLLPALNSETSPKKDSPEKKALRQMLSNILSGMSEEEKKTFSVDLASAVLANLQPFGRSGLYSAKQEQALKNTVDNVNPEKDLYADLGLEKGASASAINSSFDKLSKELEKDNAPEAKEKLEKVTYAFDTLKKEESKQLYDEKRIEPTVFSQYYGRDIVYIRFLKYSPTTYDEFLSLVKSFEKSGPTSMIFDLRQNIGGAIDFLPYLLGNFIGKDIYAYDFFAKGQNKPFRTIYDQEKGLKQFKNVAILIDGQTQSSAELMASVLKKFKYGVIVGSTSKGWGTVERIFPISNQISKDETFSIFLVHHLTIRDDGQPIEGKGVEPNISTTDFEFDSKLSAQFKYPEFERVLKQVLKSPIKN